MRIESKLAIKSLPKEQMRSRFYQICKEELTFKNNYFYLLEKIQVKGTLPNCFVLPAFPKYQSLTRTAN